MHRGVLGGQLASAVQTTHVPRLAEPAIVSHTGVLPLQSALEVQARQVSVPALQMGFAPEQFAFVRQPTHVAVGTSQMGVAPVHAVLFVAEQTPQTPLARHAGVAPLHAGSPSQEHGMPLVLYSSS